MFHVHQHPALVRLAALLSAITFSGILAMTARAQPAGDIGRC